jgi:hypothetical protein
MRQQHDLRALQRQDAPALEEVAVVADCRADPAEAEVEHRPVVRLAEPEELVERRVHLALKTDRPVGPDER